VVIPHPEEGSQSMLIKPMFYDVLEVSESF